MGGWSITVTTYKSWHHPPSIQPRLTFLGTPFQLEASNGTLDKRRASKLLAVPGEPKRKRCSPGRKETLQVPWRSMFQSLPNHCHPNNHGLSTLGLLGHSHLICLSPNFWSRPSVIDLSFVFSLSHLCTSFLFHVPYHQPFNLFF